MAVYTEVSSEDLAAFLVRYDVGDLLSAKGIAEGVENTNYLVDTSEGRFVLTLYEKRVAEADLPYFLGLTSHLAAKNLPVPAPVADARGQTLQRLNGRPACLIEYLAGVSVTRPLPEIAKAAGSALADMHRAAMDFGRNRDNAMGLRSWREMAASLSGQLDTIAGGLDALVAEEIVFLERHWPKDLPAGTIHADLFPDNVLITGCEVSGLIDFYFACTDTYAYDLAVTHAAWCFDPAGEAFDAAVAEALLEGYRPLSRAEEAAFPTLARGASLRFFLTRAHDWLHTPADALVTKKDPMAFARRLLHYRNTV